MLGGTAGGVFLHCSTSARRFCYIIKVFIVTDINTQEKDANKRIACEEAPRGALAAGAGKGRTVQLRL